MYADQPPLWILSVIVLLHYSPIAQSVIARISDMIILPFRFPYVCRKWCVLIWVVRESHFLWIQNPDLKMWWLSTVFLVWENSSFRVVFLLMNSSFLNRF